MNDSTLDDDVLDLEDIDRPDIEDYRDLIDQGWNDWGEENPFWFDEEE